MKSPLAAAMWLLVICASALAADNQDDREKEIREKLVGRWELMKEGKPNGTTMEFTKDGKVILQATVTGGTIKAVGTYKIKGEAIHITKKFGEEEVKETLKIKKLTNSELEVEGEAGKTHEFSRAK